MTPRASEQVSLWHSSVWQLGILGGEQSPRYAECMMVVVIVDQAILKMMEKGDE